MHSLQTVVDILIVGVAISALFYWVCFLFGRITTDMQDFKWWAKIILLQGVVLSAALKVLKVF